MIGARGLLVLPPVELQCENEVDTVTIREPKEMESTVLTTVVIVMKWKIAIPELVVLHTKVHLIKISKTKSMFVIK